MNVCDLCEGKGYVHIRWNGYDGHFRCPACLKRKIYKLEQENADLKKQLERAVEIIKNGQRPTFHAGYAPETRFDLVFCKICDHRGVCCGHDYDCNDAIREWLKGE